MVVSVPPSVVPTPLVLQQHSKSEVAEGDKEDPLMLEGEDQGNSPRHLNEEDLAANTGDPSSDSTPVRLRAHSLPERHARTGRQGEPGDHTTGSAPCVAMACTFVSIRKRKYVHNCKKYILEAYVKCNCSWKEVCT